VCFFPGFFVHVFFLSHEWAKVVGSWSAVLFATKVVRETPRISFPFHCAHAAAERPYRFSGRNEYIDFLFPSCFGFAFIVVVSPHRVCRIKHTRRRI
jgi:hypothetical protein